MFKPFSRKRLTQSLMTVATTLIVVGGIGVPRVSSTGSANEPFLVDWKHQTQALAQSGGRSSGGSFGSSGGSSSGGSSSNRNSAYSSDSTYNGEGELSLYILLPLVGILILFSFMSQQQETEDESSQSMVRSEKENDIVTVTQIQVAMKDDYGETKRSLNKIATEQDWRTSFGLYTALRETVKLLLAASDSWTHAHGKSKTVFTREQGKRQFEALSIAECSKFEVESLVNIDGNIQYNQASPSGSKEAKASDDLDDDENYLVVTLIVGTADDQPLLNGIESADQLANTLKQLQVIERGYLFKYELLWSPQKKKEILTATDLKEDYPNLCRLTHLAAHTKRSIGEG